MVISVTKTTKNFKSLKHQKNSVQASFLVKLSSLITEGFSLKEALQFLTVIMPKEAEWIRILLKDLERGKPIDQSLKEVGFSNRITAQIYLSLVHGRFAETLGMSGQYLTEKSRQEKQLFGLLQYPVLLLSFMVGIVFAIRIILLPNLMLLGVEAASQESMAAFIALSFIDYFPLFIGIFLLAAIGSWLGGRIYFKRLSAVKRASVLSSLPYLGKMVKLHHTQYFSYEWSQLFKSGLQLNEMIALMQQKSATKLMQETSEHLEHSLLEGKNLAESMKELSFLNEEFGFIVLHGEATGHLAIELALYSEDCRQRLITGVEKTFSYIQPMMFILIALIILCVYLALLLPMYSLFEEGML